MRAGSQLSGRTSAPGGNRASVLARLLHVIALALLAWQALVVQVHLHAPEAPVGATPAAVAQAGAQLSPTRHRPDSPLDCPICREIAHAGHYLTPDPVAYALPIAVAAWLSVAPLPKLLLGQRSHAWRSRAPPAPVHS
ncbi:MAG: hypothetical protein JO157_00390 [Acetobacteraceae bacterium]|nr:hypothetical protein [Acetobacteraceae bacterium]